MQEFDEMSDDQSGETTSKRPLTTAGVVIRLGAIGVAELCVAGAFAYTGGWLSPRRLTEDRMLAAFTDAEGLHPGFRRNHAKGVCVSGWFDSNGQAVSFSTATVFKPGRTAIVGRFGLSGANPFQADQPGIVRSMAVKFLLPGAGEWRITMNNEAVFGVNSAQGFRDQVLASIPDPATGKPDPAKIKAFMAAHPETVRAMAVIKQSPPSQGFADSTFNSLNAFRLVNAAGVSIPVRWATVPMQPFAAESAARSASNDENYLFDDLIQQIHQHPLRWRLMITIGRPGDPTDDATLPWPADRQQINAGTVTIDEVSSEDTGPCAYVNYDPLVLPSGIAPSDDPLLSARSAAYSRSFTLRAGEEAEKPPSAITLQDVQAGGKS
jgi:catalase